MSGSCGRRLMVAELVQHASKDPTRVFASIPKSANISDGFDDISFQHINCAVDEVVSLLRRSFGTFRRNETITFVGVSDLRYAIVFFAALKCGLKVFLPSPRNPITVNLSLLEQTQCQKLAYTAEVTAVVDALRSKRSDLVCLQIPPIENLLNAHPKPVPYEHAFVDISAEPILVLHSSGSTGTPKPITMTHGTFAVVDNDRNVATIPGRRNHDLTTWDFQGGGRVYVPFPPFHLAGFLNNIMVPVFSTTIPVFGPPLRPPTGRLVADILQKQEIRGCFLPPTIAADLYEQENGPELLKRLDVLCYAGGPLPEAIGNELVKHVTLCQFYGSTEVGPVRQLMPQEQFWQYMEFYPSPNQELELVEDDAYELIIHADESTRETCCLNHNLPGVMKYRTKDLFRPHPTRPGLWKFHARRDDILVLSSGEKFNPLFVESNVTAIRNVMGAIVVGNGHPQAGLIVELTEQHNAGNDPIIDIWSLVSSLNMQMPSHGRITRNRILIASANKRFIRAGKGTVVRKATEALYQGEIEQLLSSKPLVRGAQDMTANPAAIRDTLVKIFFDLLGKAPEDDDNLMILGLDSIKSTEAIELIRQSVHPSPVWLTLEVIYLNPSVNQLLPFLEKWVRDGSVPMVDRGLNIQQTLRKYVSQLGGITASKSEENSQQPSEVILIGSTGYLGQFLLKSMLEEPRIQRIHCLNRSSTARLQARNGSLEKVEFHQAEFSKPFFGLSPEVLDRLRSCDYIIHSAWQVNFVRPLSTFSDSLDGILNSIRIAAAGRKAPRLIFISSIAATGVSAERGEPKQTVPESEIVDWKQSMRTGYGESKWIAEKLVITATERSNIRASILRLGQIAPPHHGPAIWPATDALRSVLDTSKAIRQVPLNLVNVHWIPVDTTVELMMDILRYPETNTLTFYNGVNPTVTAWNSLVNVVQNWCGQGTTAKSLMDWINQLQQESAKAQISNMPAKPLVPFFELLANRGDDHEFEQANLLKLSAAARRMPPITPESLSQWLSAL